MPLPEAMHILKRRCASPSATAAPSRSTSTRSCAPSSAAAGGLPDVDAMRVATKTISGLYDGATTQRARPALDPDRRRADRRRAAVRQARRAPARHVHRQGGAQPGDPRLLAVDRDGPPPRPASTTRLADFVAKNARKLNDAIVAGARPRVRVLRPAHALRPLPAPAPADPPRHRDAAAVLPAHRLRAVRDGAPRRSSSTPVLRRSSTCPARRRCSTPAPATSSSRAASCSTRPRTTSRASTRSTPTSRCSRSSPAASASPTTACARAAR